MSDEKQVVPEISLLDQLKAQKRNLQLKEI